MKLRPTLVAAAAAVTIGGASIIGVNAVSAETPGDTLVEKIATRFNLNQDEVQAVFDEQRAEREAERATQLSERLQAKVDDGTITAEQKTTLEAKLAEMRDQHEASRDSDLTREELRDQHQEARDELQSWAAENNIPLDELLPLQGGGHGGPGGIGHGPRA